MFCIKCGEKVPEGAEYCVKCGTKVTTSEKEEKIEKKEELKEEKAKAEKEENKSLVKKEEPNKTANVNNNNNKTANVNNNKTAIIIVLTVVGGIVVICILALLIWLFVVKKSVDTYKSLSENTKNMFEETIDKVGDKVEDIIDKSEEIVEDKVEQNNKSGVTISLYKQADGNYIFSYNSNDYNKNVYEQGQYIKLDTYECNSYNCKYKDGAINKVLIYDNDYILYDVNTKKETKLNLNIDSSNDTKLIYYDKVVYGIEVYKNGKNAYYDLNKLKYITEFKYSGFNFNDGSIKFNKLIAYDDPDEENPFEHNYYIYDLKTEKVIFEGKQLNILQGKEFNNHLYFVTMNSSDIEKNSYNIYNDKFELLFEDVKKYGITDNGNIMITKDNKSFSTYNEKGNLIKTSKEYSEIKLIVNNYVAVIDDGYLKLIDYNELEIAKFTQWNDKMIFHELLSGYFTDYTTKIHGVYLVVEDESIEEGVKGRGKEYYYGTETKQTGVIELEYIGGYAKPVLYLYPEETTNIEVSFENSNVLTTTYPKYINKWNVLASPNGDLYDINGRYYYGLYWEELKNHDIDFKEGFYVTKENAIKFLEEKLEILGFNNREANEFIMYWLPVLEANGQSLVYFELTNEREAYNKLNIKPTPDSLLRVAIHVKKVDKKIDIKEQYLPTFKRIGFTVIEWGGVIH